MSEGAAEKPVAPSPGGQALCGLEADRLEQVDLEEPIKGVQEILPPRPFLARGL